MQKLCKHDIILNGITYEFVSWDTDYTNVYDLKHKFELAFKNYNVGILHGKMKPKEKDKSKKKKKIIQWYNPQKRFKNSI